MIRDDVIKTELAYAWFSVSDEPRSMLHCHAEYEVYYFIQGDVEYRIEGRPYNLAPGSLLLIPPNSFHGVTVRSSGLYGRASVHFLPELLDENERGLLLEPFQSPGGYYPGLFGGTGFWFQSLRECKDLEGPLRRAALKHRIIGLLTHVCRIRRQESGSPAPRFPGTGGSRRSSAIWTAICGRTSLWTG